jgi:predicted HicB family RNase H-like nuclease
MYESSGHLMVRIDPRTHRALWHFAIDEGKSMRELVETMVETVILKARTAPASGVQS